MKIEYYAILNFKNKYDEKFGIEISFPDFPHVVTAARSLEEAKSFAKEILRLNTIDLKVIDLPKKTEKIIY